MQVNCFTLEKHRANLQREHKVLLEGLDPAILANTHSFKLLTDRLKDGDPLRAKFTVLIHGYIKNENVNHRRMLTGVEENVMSYLMEALMVVLYYDNFIIDQKKQVNTHEAVCETLYLRNSLYDAINKYLLNHPKISNKSRIEFLKLVCDIHQVVNEGQKIECDYNHYNCWYVGTTDAAPKYDAVLAKDQMEGVIDQIKKTTIGVFPFPVDKQFFLENYLHRIYMTNAFLFVRLTRFILLKSQISPENQQKLLQYAGLFGAMHQIINDVSDFKPAFGTDITHAKDQDDDLKDLRNKNITLPLMIHLLKTKDSKIKTFLDHHACLGAFLPQVYSDDICASMAIYLAMKVGKGLQMQMSPLLNPQNTFTACLIDANRIAENNRFYRYFYERRKHLKKHT